ncbi:Protein fam72a [Podila verticillata]|nr:Protein fam72a [Podila verticillata]
MPHSIRNYYLGHVGPTATGTNGHSSGASNLSNTGIPPRGYSSSFNTSYNTNPANLPSYNYTNRHMQRAAAAAAAAAAASGNPGPHPPSSTATASTNTGSWTSRVPQYPPLQYQYYGGGSGYSSTYHGGTNGDRYNASYSHHGGSSQSKSVCRMDCRYCSAVVCLRGMKAMLLADTSVELYSTDHPPGSVQLIDKDYTTSNCKCKIRDVACRVCGNVIGYHITQPCQQCLKAPNNGHFWMFHTEGVVGQDRVNLDLQKLVQQLVNLTSSSPSSGLGGANTGPASSRPPMSSIPASARPPSATTRLTSIARQQHQPRSTLHNPEARVLTTSPSPTTPTTPTSPMPITMSSNNTTSSGSSNNNTSNPTTRTTPTGTHASPNLNTILPSLSIAQFLQPLRWEQLPHPDLDIDLDPNTMDGEPLFAAQWVDMVARTAEAVAANMSLALDQEDETERFVARMMEQEEQAQQARALHKNLSMTAGGSGEEEELEEEEEKEEEKEGEVEEIDLEQGRSGDIEDNAATMEELIDQVDEFGLASSPSPVPLIITPLSPQPVLESHGGGGGDVEVVFEVVETVVEDEKQDEADLAQQQSQRVQDSQPGMLSAPGLDNSSDRRSGSSTPGLEPNSISHAGHHHMLSGLTAADDPSSSPATVGFLNSAMIAREAASAAAADAEAAAHSLVFGRRPRRDYDMMCR